MSIVCFELDIRSNPWSKVSLCSTTSLFRGTLLFSPTGVSEEIDFYIFVCMGVGAAFASMIVLRYPPCLKLVNVGFFVGKFILELVFVGL